MHMYVYVCIIYIYIYIYVYGCLLDDRLGLLDVADDRDGAYNVT